MVMDSHMRHELDNYITGGRYSEWMEELVCAECGYKWEAKMFTEYGMTSYYDDEDSVCPKCGKEHE